MGVGEVSRDLREAVRHAVYVRLGCSTGGKLRASLKIDLKSHDDM